ncbi:hypothetical protein AAC387_Pa10g1715 [Persea americana]
MASFPESTISFQIAIVVFLTATAIKSLSSPLTLEMISTISAEPALLPALPLSSAPDLAPDITPLLPSPSSIVPSPSDMLPTIPSNPSPSKPDEMAGTGLNSAVSPSGSFTAVASTSAAAPPSSAGCSLALCFGLVVFCLLQLLGGFS